MTVSHQTPNNSGTGNGVTTVFPYTFKVLAQGDLEVLVDGVVQTLTTHYTLSGVGDNGGGNVTFVTAPANGTTVVRRRNMAYVRTTDYQDQGEMPADVLNPDQDAPVLMIQQLGEGLGRAPKVPKGEAAIGDLPSAEDRALKFLGFDVDGNPFASAGTGASGSSDFVDFLQAGTGAVNRFAQGKMREIVTPEDYGAVGDGVTDDTAAWTAMDVHLLSAGGGEIRAKKSYYLPLGFEITASNVLLDGCGTGEIHALGTTNPAIYGNGLSRVTAQNLASFVPRTNLRSDRFNIYFEGCQYVTVRGCRTDGGVTGLWFNDCDDVLAEGNIVDTPKADGIHFSHGSQRCKAIGNTIIDPADDAMATTYDDVGTGRPADILFANNTVKGGYWGFGVSIYSADRVIVTGNSFNDLAFGMVNVTASGGGAACTDVLITGNAASGLCRAETQPETYWYGVGPDPAVVAESFMSGAYLAGTDIVFTHNKINEVSSVPSSNTRRGVRFGPCTRLTVKGNSFASVNGIGIHFGTDTIDQAAVDNNDFQSVFDMGIFCDTTITTGFSICGNTHGYGALGASPYSIFVGSTGVVPGRVCNNISYTGKAIHDTGANTSLVAYNNTTAKKSSTSWTPTVTSQTGAITAYTVNRAQYILIEQLLHIQVDITITTNGTGATAVVITLPEVLAGIQYVAGREIVLSGSTLVAEANGSALSVRKYDNSYPGGNGARLILTGVLEKA